MSGLNKSELIVIDCPIESITSPIEINTAYILDLYQSFNNQTSKTISTLTQNEKDLIRYNSLREIMCFGDRMIDGKSVAKHLIFDNSSIFYYHRFRILEQLTSLEIKVQELLKQKPNFEKITIYTVNNNLKNYLKNPSWLEFILVNQKKEKINLNALLAVIKLYPIRVLKGLLFNSSVQKKFKLAIIDTPSSYIKDGEDYKNPYLNSLLNSVGNNVLLISELPVLGIKGKNIFQTRDNYSVHNGKKNILWSEYLLVRTFLTQHKKWKQTISKVDNSLKNLSKQDWTSKQRFILNSYINLKKTTNFYILKEIAYQDFFINSNLKALLASDENSIAQRVVLNAAKLNMIRTYGVQHGAIGKTSANYVYSKKDFSNTPIPDLTFIWGNYWKEILIKEGNYPPSKLLVVGQLRTDNINYLSSKKVSKQKQIVFASQPIPDENLRQQALQDVYKLADTFSDHKFIIRNHPRENNLNYFTDKMTSYKLDNLKIDGKTDLYKQLSQTDILITCYSTVAIEALYFNISVILIDYGKTDILNLENKNVVDISYSYADLEFYISQKISLSTYTNENVIKYRVGLSYKLDGKVAERILSKIENL